MNKLLKEHDRIKITLFISNHTLRALASGSSREFAKTIRTLEWSPPHRPLFNAILKSGYILDGDEDCVFFSK